MNVAKLYILSCELLMAYGKQHHIGNHNHGRGKLHSSGSQETGEEEKGEEGKGTWHTPSDLLPSAMPHLPIISTTFL